MRILITGAAGFIGSHLGNKLVKLGHEVDGIDDFSHPSKNRITFRMIEQDFSMFSGAIVNLFDVIFHLAAHINVDESIKDPIKYLDNNSLKTTVFLEMLRKNKYKGKFIFASSAEVYGTARTPTMSEDHPLDPLSPYAVAKLAAERMCSNYADLYGLDVTIVRNFNTFGDFQGDGMYGGVIAKFKEQAKRGGPLTVYGSGEQMRDYMHISQAVDGYVLATEARMPRVVNFGSGKPIRIIDIANYIGKKFGVDVIHTKPRPNEVMRLEADITRANMYGYKMSTDFWSHLNEFLENE